MKPRRNIEDLLNRYLKGKASEQEVGWVEEWFKKLDQVNGNRVLNPEEEISLHESTRKAIEKRLRKNNHNVVSLWPLLAAASVVLLAVSFLFLFSPTKLEQPVKSDKFSSAPQKFLQNKAETEKRFLLPDSSVVILTANSSLEIDEAFNSKNRRVILQGEAFFEVTHNPQKPFYVHAGEVVTKVLGTSFVVRAFDNADNITVSVRTGKVSVFTSVPSQNTDPRNTEPLIVLPNQQIVFSRTKGEVAKMLVENPVALVEEKATEKIKYVSAPISEVLAALQELYGVEIEYDSVAFSSCRLTTTLGGDGIYSRLNSICKAIESTYHEENGKIVLLGEGCKE
jgi:transmembrane sensor